ncbi:MAG: dTDP-4-dehydrorhamnose reductase [Chloroflexota bacterium]
MRIFITGFSGQLGQALATALAGETLYGPDHRALDITDLAATKRAIANFAPDIVIHAAAMTHVDECALHPEQAYRVNALGTRNVALACQATGATLAYISTNEVFNGFKTEPYWEYDLPDPINAYGRSKLAGEWFTQTLLQRFYIIRTAWLYSRSGANFLHKILRLADERGALQVVTDEVSSPTYAPDLAQAIAQLIRTGCYGIYHLVNEGACSRFALARRALELTGRQHVTIQPISRFQYRRPSTPPAYTALRNFAGAELGIRLRPWEEALSDFLKHET